MEGIENMDVYGDCNNVPLSVINNIDTLENQVEQILSRLELVEKRKPILDGDGIKNHVTVSPKDVPYIFLQNVMGQIPFLVFQIGTAEKLERLMVNLNSVQCVSKERINNDFHITLQIDLRGNNHLLNSFLTPDVDLDGQSYLFLEFSTKDEAGQRLTELFF